MLLLNLEANLNLNKYTSRFFFVFFFCYVLLSPNVSACSGPRYYLVLIMPWSHLVAVLTTTALKLVTTDRDCAPSCVSPFQSSMEGEENSPSASTPASPQGKTASEGELSTTAAELLQDYMTTVGPCPMN